MNFITIFMNKNLAQKKILKCYDFYIERQIFLENFKNNYFNNLFKYLSLSNNYEKSFIKYDEWGHEINFMNYYLDGDGDILIPKYEYYNLVNNYNIKNFNNKYLAIAIIIDKLNSNKNFKFYKPEKIFSLLDYDNYNICFYIWKNYFIN